jgi:hypothetical protein
MLLLHNVLRRNNVPRHSNTLPCRSALHHSNVLNHSSAPRRRNEPHRKNVLHRSSALHHSNVPNHSSAPPRRNELHRKNEPLHLRNVRHRSNVRPRRQNVQHHSNGLPPNKTLGRSNVRRRRSALRRRMIRNPGASSALKPDSKNRGPRPTVGLSAFPPERSRRSSETTESARDSCFPSWREGRQADQQPRTNWSQGR